MRLRDNMKSKTKDQTINEILAMYEGYLDDRDEELAEDCMSGVGHLLSDPIISHEMDQDEYKEVKNLLLSAPELLEALKRVYPILLATEGDYSKINIISPSEQVKQAINKAERI